MTASNFHSKPSVPAAVADLDLALVAEVLARNGCNVSDAAAELHVPPSDLRRLMWSKPKLQDEAFEVVEGRLDLAEKNIGEALRSDDPRMRVAASMFTLRNCRFTLIVETARVRYFRALLETCLFSRHPNWDWRPIFVHLKWD